VYKQGEGRGLKNSDLALPEGSIAKRRGVKVITYEGQKGVRELTKWGAAKATNPKSSWCANAKADSSVTGVLVPA
jgi:hypothetical protein